ncbi:hypothetical protein B2I21_05155, partial [Chryseobacterium mucoviscidosis]
AGSVWICGHLPENDRAQNEEIGGEEMTFQELKINLAEWLLLKVKYPSEYVMGTPGLRRFEQYKGKKKIILTLIPSHDNLGD